MRSKKKIVGIVGLFLIIVSIMTISFVGFGKKEDINIEEVLSSEEYSYLPKEALNFVRDNYEETGVVVLTEKNKEPGKPYLNPSYVEYLELSSEKKEEVEIVPFSYAIDYKDEYENSGIFPSKYDLRNVDEKNYITPLKDQTPLGICWSFAINEVAESYLLKTQDKSFGYDSEIFSPRQLDYATAKNGIKSYSNEYGNRFLATGGNFYSAVTAMQSGVAFVHESDFPFNDSLSERDLVDVLSYDKSNYILNSSTAIGNLDFSMFDINSDNGQMILESYLNNIKSKIVNYGGAFVGTESPNAYCGFKNPNGDSIISVNENCLTGYGHALQIIGWDDDIRYKYCTIDGQNYDIDSGYCSAYIIDDVHDPYYDYIFGDKLGTFEVDDGVLISSGKGAWLLRNSWGKDSGYDYVYLAYDSLNSDIEFITELGKRQDDYAYVQEIDGFLSYEDYIAIDEKFDIDEIVDQVKFTSFSYDSDFTIGYDVWEDEAGFAENELKTIHVSEPGVVTLSLMDLGVHLQSDMQFYVSSTDGYVLTGSLAVYTNSPDPDRIALTDDVISRTIVENETVDNYIVDVLSYTRGIPSGNNVDYELYDEDELIASSVKHNNMSVENNVDVENNILATLTIDGSIDPGTYTLKIIYDSEVIGTASVELIKTKGTGTVDDPFIITTPRELDLLNQYSSSYFELGADIDLEHDTSDENGYFYNDGVGWYPIGLFEGHFSGSLDGKGHTISGIYSEYQNAAFIDAIEPKYGDVYIKNLNIESCYFEGLFGAAVLVDSVFPNEDYSVNIQNIRLHDNYVSAFKVGGLIDRVYDLKKSNNLKSINISNIFSDTYISSFSNIIWDAYAGGLIGEVLGADEKYNETLLQISDVEIFSNVDISNKLKAFGEIIGLIQNGENVASINNVITKNNYRFYFEDDVPSLGVLIGEYSSDSGIVNDTVIKANNVYSVSDIDWGPSNIISNLEMIDCNQYSVRELRDGTDIYDDWEDFDEYWEHKKVDDMMRIPVLKIADFEYMKFARDEEYEIGDYVHFDGFFEPFYQGNIEIEILEDENGVFEAIDGENYYKIVNYGTVKYKYYNDYDGIEGEGVFTLEAPEDSYTIVFDSNDEYYDNWFFGDMENIDVLADEDFLIPKNEYYNYAYKFMGWNTKPDGSGESFSDEQLIPGDTYEPGKVLRLYAQWKDKTYSIEFDLNGGSGDVSNMDDLLFSQEVYLPFDGLTKTGYVFGYWTDCEYSENNGSSSVCNTYYDTGDSLYGLAEEDGEVITLYAYWYPISYSIIFDANGGSGVMQDMYFLSYDVDYDLFKNEYTRDGYTFVGWNTKADGTGTSYSDQENIINLSNVDDDEITLYAQWKKNEDQFNIVVSKYSYTKGNNYIDKIDYNTKVSNFLKNISVTSGYSVTVYNGSTLLGADDLVPTGSMTRVTKGSQVILELYNVVRGDVNRDGKISALDYVAIKNHIMGSSNIGWDIQVMAADFNYDGKISALDYVKIKNVIMN